MSLLVGISGKKESGKSTSAKRAEKWGYQAMSFAQPIKQLCMNYFDLTPEDVYGSRKEITHPKWGTTPRKIMQFVGTDLFREKLGELIGGDLAGDFWINRFKKDYEKVCEPKCVLSRTHTQVGTGLVSVGYSNKQQKNLPRDKSWDKCVVVDDVRFPNEVQTIRDLGGKLIKIKRPTVADDQFGLCPNADRPCPLDNHVSEQELDDCLFDHIIINDGTLEELEKKIDDLLT